MPIEIQEVVTRFSVVPANPSDPNPVPDALVTLANEIVALKQRVAELESRFPPTKVVPARPINPTIRP